MNKPYVSCIMPTADRPNFIKLAIHYFLNQDYSNAELIIVDDGKQPVDSLITKNDRIKYYYFKSLGSIGFKRNFGCSKSTGDIIMHWDDDDYYAKDWISRQLNALEMSKADIVGLNSITFFSPLVNKFWKYEDKGTLKPWLSGATLAYKKSFWMIHPFKDLQVGEDYDFIWNSGAKIYAHNYPNGFIAILHANNTTLKPFENPKYKKNGISYMAVEFSGNTENPVKE